MTQSTTDRVTIRLVTPDMAARWLEAMPYEHQRKLRQTWVNHLCDEIRRGTFMQNTTIRIATLDGRSVLLDGQHRLWAVVETGLPQSFIVHDTYARDTNEVAWMYGNTDIGLRRSASDLYSALDLQTEMGLTRDQVDRLAASINLLFVGLVGSVRSQRPHRDELLAGMRLYAPYAQSFLEISAGNDAATRFSKRSTTLALALLTFRFSLPYAQKHGAPTVESFWQGALFDDGLAANDYRKHVNKHLLTSRMLSGRASGAMVVTPAETIRFLATCFNGFMAGRTIIRSPRIVHSSEPITIYGVPRDPKKWLD